MDIKTINADAALRALEGVVAGREEYVYDSANGCNYEWEGKPSCVVGQALHELGLPISVLAEMDLAKGEDYYLDGDIFVKDATISQAVKIVHARSNLRLTNHAVGILSEAQSHQDMHSKWGVALDAANYLHTHYKGLSGEEVTDV